jgi:hypothetical protein
MSTQPRRYQCQTRPTWFSNERVYPPFQNNIEKGTKREQRENGLLDKDVFTPTHNFSGHTFFPLSKLLRFLLLFFTFMFHYYLRAHVWQAEAQNFALGSKCSTLRDSWAYLIIFRCWHWLHLLSFSFSQNHRLFFGVREKKKKTGYDVGPKGATNCRSQKGGRL